MAHLPIELQPYKVREYHEWHAVMTIGEFGANALTEDSAKRIYNDLRELLPEHLAKGTYRVAIFDAANDVMLKADIVNKSL